MTGRGEVARARLRIGLVELYGVGGTADYTDCLAQALAARGHEIAVLSSSQFRPLEASPAYRVMRVYRYRTSQPKVAKALQLASSLGEARQAIRRFSPDIVHAQGTVMPLIERRFYRALSPVARICTVHDVGRHEWRPWLGSLMRFYAGFDALVCHSWSSLRRLQASLPSASVHVIPHGRYAPLASPGCDRSRARVALGLPQSARVVLMFGFLRPYKGLDVFLDAVALASTADAAVIGMVAGRPLYDIASSRSAAQRRGTPVRWDLRFIPRDELAVHFAAADVVALPYLDTSDSGMIELAAAFAKPVVVTSAGGLTEAFARYGVGSVVPPGDAAALAEAMLAPYDGCSANGRGENSWADVALRTERLYREALSGAVARVRG